MTSPAAAPTASAQQDLVLVVEDEAPIADAIAFVVEDAGYTPMVATHARDALTQARERWPALVITDLMMPQMSGAELIAALRAEAAATARPAPPVILVTAAGHRYAMEAGADAVLRKPFDLDDLELLVHRYLRPESGAARV